MTDLFEFLRVATQSDYINDMRSGINNYCARELMKTIKYENYPLSVLSDCRTLRSIFTAKNRFQICGGSEKVF